MNARGIFTLIFCIVLCAALLALNEEQLRGCRADLAESNAELAQALEREKGWIASHEMMSKANDALKSQASSCLEREAAAMADAAQWQELLAKMELRQMTDKEREEVPDDTTRKALLDALDRPL